MAKSFEQAPIVAALEARLEEICLPQVAIVRWQGFDHTSFFSSRISWGLKGVRETPSNRFQSTVKFWQSRRSVAGPIPLRNTKAPGQHEMWDCSLDFIG